MFNLYFRIYVDIYQIKFHLFQGFTSASLIRKQSPSVFRIESMKKALPLNAGCADFIVTALIKITAEPGETLNGRILLCNYFITLTCVINFRHFIYVTELVEHLHISIKNCMKNIYEQLPFTFLNIPITT